MKTKSRLIIGALLLAPGVYAIIRWSMIDADRKNQNQDEIITRYKNVLYTGGLSFTMLVLILLVLAMTGVLIAAYSKTKASNTQSGLRIFLMIVGITQIAMLLFSVL